MRNFISKKSFDTRKYAMHLPEPPADTLNGIEVFNFALLSGAEHKKLKGNCRDDRRFRPFVFQQANL
jgi:hypothetical protein